MDINIIKLMALAVLVLPLFALPFIMKAAGGILERFGVWANNRQKGLIDRSRNWARDNSKRANATQRARLASTEVGKRWGEGWGYNPDGSEKAGRLAQLQRTLGRGANRAGTATRGTSQFVGGYQARRDFRHTHEQDNAKRMQDAEIYSLLDEKDADGNPTERAQSFAARAAGAGGEKNAERIRRLGMEQRKKALMEDVGRETSALSSAGAMDSGAFYYELNADGSAKHVDASGNAVGYSDHGRAMVALSRGGRLGVVKAGHEQSLENAKKSIVSGDTTAKKYAAMKRITDIGDGAAIGYALYGDADQGIEALDDKDISDFVQFAGDNAGKIAPKLSHLITNDNGLNGVSGEALANWHGNEFKAAASRVRQLREQAGRATDPAEKARFNSRADKIQDAVETAYETLATNAELEGQFKQKHVDAMRTFYSIIEGVQRNNAGQMVDASGAVVTNVGAAKQVNRAVMREYGDRLTDASGAAAPGVVNGEIVDRNGLTTTTKHAGNVIIGNAVGKFK